MKPERWQQIEELCQAALDRAQEQRVSFLDAACAGDEALRREVESLLKYREPAKDFMEGPALEVAAKVAAADQGRSWVSQQMSHYRTLSLLGAGGMGKVYLAEDINLSRRVALKLLPAEFTRNAGRVRRFKQEARALSALNHPNIVTIYEVGEVADTHYIATEFIDGHTLRQRMNSEMMPLGDAIEVAVQVASALVAAHDSGVIHRDVKPENIMVRKDGLVKVLDFGLAKLAEAEADGIDTSAQTNEAINTETGVVMGTVRYMSPEQARGLTLDARSDIFSLGVVLHEMLSGKSPFAGATTADVVAAILAKEPPPITQYRQEAPETLDALERILTLLLRKERAERYQTAQEMLADLKRLKQRLEIEVEFKRDAAASNGRENAATDEENAAEAGAPRTIASAENLKPIELYGQTEPEGLAAPHKRTAVIWKLMAVVATLVLVFITTWMFLPNRPSAPPVVASITSLAILPLENLSHDPEQEYFADGMTEELSTQLMQLGNLRVPGRTSVMRYKGTKKSLTEIARELSVDALVEGSVLDSGGKVRITVRLIRAGGKEQSLWAQHYDADGRDVLTLQNEVARDIAREIKIQLSPREQQRLARAETVDPEAHNAYLLGRHFWNRADVDGYLKAIDYFEKAQDLAPGYAAPFAGLADTYVDLAYSGVLSPKDAYEAVRKQATQALQLDPELSDANVSLAMLNDYDWNWTEAESRYKRALTLNPNYSTGHMWYASHLAALGRFPEAIAEAQAARDLDPGSLKVNFTVGLTYYLARDYPAAIEAYQRTLDLDPQFSSTHEALANVYEMKGMPDQAFGEFQKYLVTGGVPAAQISAFERAYRSSGMRGYVQKLLEREDEDEKLGNGVWPLRRASLYARLGDKERAFQWLETAFSQRNPRLQELRVEPMYDSLRNDPRFLKFVERLRLPSAPRRETHR